MENPPTLAELGASIPERIGNTPLVRLDQVVSKLQGITLLGKAEWANPGGSVKDRPAASMVADARTRGLLVPGGFMPDKLRRDAKVLSLTREFFEQGKLVAFICHGGWIPISAKILRGRRVTGSLGIKDDLENAGAIWVNEPVVVDGNLISSRTPRDCAPFGAAMVNFLDAIFRH